MSKIISTILKRRKYYTIAGIAAALFASISYYLTVVNVYHNDIFIYADMNGTGFTIVSLFLGVITSILLGLYIALFVFRRDIIKKMSIGNNAATFSGTTIGILASGCPSCGVPLLGLVGFPLALYSLPFKGLELKILSIALLILGIYLILKSIKKSLVCNVDNN